MNQNAEKKKPCHILCLMGVATVKTVTTTTAKSTSGQRQATTIHLFTFALTGFRWQLGSIDALHFHFNLLKYGGVAALAWVLTNPWNFNEGFLNPWILNRLLSNYNKTSRLKYESI